MDFDDHKKMYVCTKTDENTSADDTSAVLSDSLARSLELPQSPADTSMAAAAAVPAGVVFC